MRGYAECTIQSLRILPNQQVLFANNAYDAILDGSGRVSLVDYNLNTVFALVPVPSLNLTCVDDTTFKLIPIPSPKVEFTFPTTNQYPDYWLGPAVLLNDKKSIVIGGTKSMSEYDPATLTWRNYAPYKFSYTNGSLEGMYRAKLPGSSYSAGGEYLGSYNVFWGKDGDNKSWYITPGGSGPSIVSQDKTMATFLTGSDTYNAAYTSIVTSSIIFMRAHYNWGTANNTISMFSTTTGQFTGTRVLHDPLPGFSNVMFYNSWDNTIAWTASWSGDCIFELRQLQTQTIGGMGMGGYGSVGKSQYYYALAVYPAKNPKASSYAMLKWPSATSFGGCALTANSWSGAIQYPYPMRMLWVEDKTDGNGKKVASIAILWSCSNNAENKYHFPLSIIDIPVEGA